MAQQPKAQTAAATPAPSVSKTVQRLLAQIHTEAQAATLAALSAKDGIVTLHPVDAETARLMVTADELDHSDASGNRTYAYRRREEPKSWRNSRLMQGHWNPAHWTVQLTRIDSMGREWNCHLGNHVVNDFGDLVPVEGGAA